MLTILYGSQGGNARNLAMVLGESLGAHSIDNEVLDMGEVDPDSVSGSVLYLKVNVQDHTFPILTPATPSATDVNTYKILAVGLGLKLEKKYEDWILSAQGTYQIPISVSSQVQDFKLSKQTYFDAEIKAMKALSERLFIGAALNSRLFQHEYEFFDTVNSVTDSGAQQMMFNDLSFQMRWNF